MTEKKKIKGENFPGKKITENEKKRVLNFERLGEIWR